MPYQVLARKWRPQDFDSIIGQEAAVTALRNAITEKRIAQAYLFAGIRGVGKTTAARVFAKALNCEEEIGSEARPGADPCSRCVRCVEIARGSDLDVLEIDAATYSKVEQVRELTESLRYGPARDRYKVVVLDEVHRLSRQAFDALLKIVEEPPEHLVFVFATTEMDMVPATVLSRCQEFHFRRVAGRVLCEHLAKIAEAESIEVGESALRLIARAGDGSVRDAVALLDQLATFGSGAIGDDDAARLLGGLDFRLFHDLLQSILAGETANVSRTIRDIESRGWDPRQVHAQFLGYCRDALHASLGLGEEQLEMPSEEAEKLLELAHAQSHERLLQLLQLLLRCEESIRRSDTPSLAVEVAWLKGAELPKLTRLLELLGKSDPAGGAPTSGGGRAATGHDRSTGGTSAGAAQATRGTEPGASTPGADAPPKPAPKTKSAAAPAAASTAGLLERLEADRPQLARHLSRADLEWSGSRLEVRSAADDDLLRAALERPQNRVALEEAVAATWGRSGAWQSTVLPATASRPTPAASGDETAPGSSFQDAPAPAPAIADAMSAEERDTEEGAAPPRLARTEPGPSGGGDDEPRGDEDIDEEDIPPDVLEHPAVQATLDVFSGSIDAVRRASPPTKEPQ